MSSALAEAHIRGQKRLRDLAATGVERAWRRLPGYDERNVSEFLTAAVPLVGAAQRQSAALTNAYLARRLGRTPIGIDPSRLTGGGVRAGVDPREVYRRPFVTVWASLKAGHPWESAVAAGLARAAATAAMDVQLSMRATLVDVGERDDVIVGYQRVPDAGACDFCQLVAGQRYTTDQLMPVHNHCGCSVDVITSDFKPERDLSVTREDGFAATVEEHGELGPVLVNADHHFEVV